MNLKSEQPLASRLFCPRTLLMTLTLATRSRSPRDSHLTPSEDDKITPILVDLMTPKLSTPRLLPTRLQSPLRKILIRGDRIVAKKKSLLILLPIARSWQIISTSAKGVVDQREKLLNLLKSRTMLLNSVVGESRLLLEEETSIMTLVTPLMQTKR